MIELTEEQAQALAAPQSSPARIVNPRTHEAFVLLPVDEYARLTAGAYDDTAWTRDELQALAWQAVDRGEGDGNDDDDNDDAGDATNPEK